VVPGHLWTTRHQRKKEEKGQHQSSGPGTPQTISSGGKVQDLAPTSAREKRRVLGKGHKEETQGARLPEPKTPNEVPEKRCLGKIRLAQGRNGLASKMQMGQRGGAGGARD